MKTKIGIWIDHRKALIVAVTDKDEEIKLIISKVERQPGRVNGKKSTAPYESLEVAADDTRERKLTSALRIYYGAVVSCVRDAESIFIFGPGEAKGELKKLLVKDKLGSLIVGVETIDKMTDRQIAAKVRTYYQGNKGSKKK